MLRPCLNWGCPNLTRHSRCAFHAKIVERERVARRGNRYDYQYRKLRVVTLKAQPWCTYCGSTERLTADHVGDELVTACLSCNVKRMHTERHG